jgi:hypothetical protein
LHTGNDFGVLKLQKERQIDAGMAGIIEKVTKTSWKTLICFLKTLPCGKVTFSLYYNLTDAYLAGLPCFGAGANLCCFGLRK